LEEFLALVGRGGKRGSVVVFFPGALVQGDPRLQRHGRFFRQATRPSARAGGQVFHRLVEVVHQVVHDPVAGQARRTEQFGIHRDHGGRPWKVAVALQFAEIERCAEEQRLANVLLHLIERSPFLNGLVVIQKIVDVAQGRPVASSPAIAIGGDDLFPVDARVVRIADLRVAALIGVPAVGADGTPAVLSCQKIVAVVQAVHVQLQVVRRCPVFRIVDLVERRALQKSIIAGHRYGKQGGYGDKIAYGLHLDSL